MSAATRCAHLDPIFNPGGILLECGGILHDDMHVTALCNFEGFAQLTLGKIKIGRLGGNRRRDRFVYVNVFAADFFSGNPAGRTKGQPPASAAWECA